MTPSRITFQTRARTIDHLGRGQIADCPTAVSELWKNAYDAYADAVSLHIYDGATPIAAIFDDGIGMSREDFLERWLVVGTDSKIRNDSDRTDIPPGHLPRPRQGEKGIGRLSAAFLAPVTLILSKRREHDFAAVMVDWRLFENPFLALEDIAVAVESFKSLDELTPLLTSMRSTLAANVAPSNDDPRCDRLVDAWTRFDDYERSIGLVETTSDRILSFQDVVISDRHLLDWPAYGGAKETGTAILLLGVHRELSVQVSTSASDDDAEIQTVRLDLIRTLTGFTDPFQERREAFDYEVVIHQGGFRRSLVSANDVFGLDEFRSLEHSIEGDFDEAGVFRGKLRVFGKDRGEIVHVPRRPPPRAARERLGPFSFCIGTFEVMADSSTHSDEIHAAMYAKAEKYGGVYVYRDNLRIMPYGNPEADLYQIEERRSRHAGRNFWSHRRSFGRTAFNRENNPNLRDKAGREGLVDNRAFRELQILVTDLLSTVGKRYFGTDSDIRNDELPEIQKRNKLAKEAANKSTRARSSTFRRFLKENADATRHAVAHSVALRQRLAVAIEVQDAGEVAIIADEVEKLQQDRDRLRLPPLPARLGDQEVAYRRYRDDYRALSATSESLGSELSAALESLRVEDPEDVATRRLHSNQSRLSAKIDRYRRTIDGQMVELRGKWHSQAESDFKQYYLRASPLLGDLGNGLRLSTVLNGLDAIAAELDEDFAARYEPFLRALEQLRNDIDLDGALTVTENERVQLDRRVNEFNVLAQMGIAIEIIGHELDTMDAEVRRNLHRLPQEIKKSDAFRLAFEAHTAITERLRFLAPLRLAGYRSRETITGEFVANFVENFFQRRFKDDRIIFEATKSFRSIRVTDLRSRLLPVFINLVNNALYWVRFVDNRKITLDCVNDLVVLADSGLGVDPDDVANLFDLFFTRRTNGRGVGLHLCKLNLAVSHHDIRYAGQDDPKILPGANFIIEFRGMTHG
ncbi:ATP-binding protein [Novosphingobium sediminicola]|uniref:Signal transduction histidine kinase n=1 Tax=Novosphingobium sediminicola TaxID=563162 RepID=A0A7W6CBB5_9SPHN|nr:ATP-binding protein [Novosphingobium sediminicola]MBB3953414.1 signal transduction histidine kinase [Novosphingobium sediminicola]